MFQRGFRRRFRRFPGFHNVSRELLGAFRGISRGYMTLLGVPQTFESGFRGFKDVSGGLLEMFQCGVSGRFKEIQDDSGGFQIVQNILNFR